MPDIHLNAKLPATGPNGHFDMPTSEYPWPPPPGHRHNVFIQNSYYFGVVFFLGERAVKPWRRSVEERKNFVDTSFLGLGLHFFLWARTSLHCRHKGWTKDSTISISVLAIFDISVSSTFSKKPISLMYLKSILSIAITHECKSH